MRNRLSRSFLGIGAVLVAAMLGLSAATLSYSAPSEENLSGSATARTTPRSAPEGSQGRPFTRSRDNAEAQASDEGAAEEGGESVPGVVSPPRAVFPYTVRSGDTPASIAALFGVSLADLMRANHLRQDSELMIGQTLRVPNPFLARERELSSEIDRLTAEKQAADERAQKIQDSLSGLHSQVQDLSTSNLQYGHNLRVLPWWRAAAFLAGTVAALMLGAMLVAVIQWWILRSRFHAVAEMNESLRRLDYKYKAALAKAELRFQELYGRRRRGVQDGQERAKTPEEAEIEQLNRRLKEVLEHHLQRLDRPSARAGRAWWRERLAGIGAPVEARSVRR